MSLEARIYQNILLKLMQFYFNKSYILAILYHLSCREVTFILVCPSFYYICIIFFCPLSKLLIAIVGVPKPKG